MLRSRRRRLFAVRLGCVLVLLLAIAPQVLYLGRPLTEEQLAAATQSMPPGHEHHAEAAAKHAGHCHVGPKGCAAVGGVVHIASFDTLIQLFSEDGGVPVVEGSPVLRGFVLWQRPEKPPQTI